VSNYKLTKYEKLFDAVHESEIVYVATDSHRRPAKAIHIGGDYGIIFNESAFKTTAERYTALAHDKAHCDTGAVYRDSSSLYTKRQAEEQAWRETIRELLPFEAFRDAMLECVKYHEYFAGELAERFGVTEELVEKAIVYYRDRCGYKW